MRFQGSLPLQWQQHGATNSGRCPKRAEFRPPALCWVNEWRGVGFHECAEFEWIWRVTCRASKIRNCLCCFPSSGHNFAEYFSRQEPCYQFRSECLYAGTCTIYNRSRNDKYSNKRVGTDATKKARKRACAHGSSLSCSTEYPMCITETCRIFLETVGASRLAGDPGLLLLQKRLVWDFCKAAVSTFTFAPHSYCVSLCFHYSDFTLGKSSRHTQAHFRCTYAFTLGVL